MTKKYFILLTFLCLFVAGCVEKNRLDKYDTAMFDTKKLEVVEQVELQPAEDQSMDRDPNIVLESEAGANRALYRKMPTAGPPE